MAITKGEIGNALTSTASDHVVAVAGDIYDESLEAYQEDINAEVADAIEATQGQLGGMTITTLTEDEYEALETVDDNTLYFCTEEEE